MRLNTVFKRWLDARNKLWIDNHIHNNARKSYGKDNYSYRLVHQWRKETGDYKTSSEGIKSKILDVIISLEGCLHGTDNDRDDNTPAWWCTTTGIPSRIVYPDNRIYYRWCYAKYPLQIRSAWLDFMRESVLHARIRSCGEVAHLREMWWDWQVWESVHPGLRSEKKRENQTRRWFLWLLINFYLWYLERTVVRSIFVRYAKRR